MGLSDASTVVHGCGRAIGLGESWCPGVRQKLAFGKSWLSLGNLFPESSERPLAGMNWRLPEGRPDLWQKIETHWVGNCQRDGNVSHSPTFRNRAKIEI